MLHRTVALTMTISALSLNISLGADDKMPRTLICDLHCDTALNLADGRGIGRGSGESHVTLEKLKKGGVSLQVFACWVSPKYRHHKAWARAQQMINAVKKEVAAHPDIVMLVTDRESWQECRSRKLIGILLAVEGGHALDGNITLLDSLYLQGVRILTLTWNNSNHFACSAYSAHRTGSDKGLTPLGRKLISRADRLGMNIDLSHSSERTFWDVMELSRRPPLLSHSCVKFLNGHFRNATDRQIRALAGRGGLLGINFCPAFLGASQKPANVGSVADQFEYVKELAGTDLLAIGSDFDGIRETPENLGGPDELPGLLEALRSRGFSDRELDDVGGSNFLRYLGWQ